MTSGCVTACRRVLVVQHAGAPGGSVMSLRYLIQGLIGRGLVVSVAMVEPNAAVRAMYEEDGAHVYDAPEIPLFRHTTAGWASVGDPRAFLYQMRAVLKSGRGGHVLQSLIDDAKPDIVHLNSVTLALAARALSESPTPVVWHVRESPVNGYFGVRRRFLRSALLSYGDDVIFLSASDQAAWVDGKRGVVVPNVVPVRSQPSAEAIAAVRSTFRAEEGDRLVAYAGGYQEIKGIFPLLDAVRRLLPDFPRLRILAPGMAIAPAGSWRARVARRLLPIVGMARDYERAAMLVATPEMQRVFLRQPFVHDILPVLAAAEFAVFPSTRPHFARPVMEAALVGRPSVGSRLGGVADLIEDGKTGVLVPPGDAPALAAAMRAMLDDEAGTRRMGEAAAAAARNRFDADAQVERVLGIYAAVLARRAAQKKPAA